MLLEEGGRCICFTENTPWAFSKRKLPRVLVWRVVEQLCDWVLKRCFDDFNQLPVHDTLDLKRQSRLFRSMLHAFSWKLQVHRGLFPAIPC